MSGLNIRGKIRVWVRCDPTGALWLTLQKIDPVEHYTVFASQQLVSRDECLELFKKKKKEMYLRTNKSVIWVKIKPTPCIKVQETSPDGKPYPLNDYRVLFCCS